jgi:hypothetical protein
MYSTRPGFSFARASLRGFKDDDIAPMKDLAQVLPELVFLNRVG